MLPKENRLRHRQDFNAVYRSGLRRHSAYLTLRALRRGSKDVETSVGAPPPTRIGISISQKVSKRAIARNRLKRQIRAALRQLLPRLSPGWDLAIVVLPTAQECNYGQFLQELEQLLAQAEVLNGHSRGSVF